MASASQNCRSAAFGTAQIMPRWVYRLIREVVSAGRAQTPSAGEIAGMSVSGQAALILTLFVVLLTGCTPDAAGAAKARPITAVGMTAASVLTTPTRTASLMPAGGVETRRDTNVVDGDTVDVASASGSQERIRVIGVDTPERGECGFADASAALAALVQGKSVTLAAGARDDRDHYGRLLRYLDVSGQDAGLALIQAGYAIARYDSRDGYGRHPREASYVAADAASPNMCGRPAAAAPIAPGMAPTTGVQVFRNCADLNAVYPGGVARVGVTGNTVSGALRPFRVTPRFDDALYAANRTRDGDDDGVACEK